MKKQFLTALAVWIVLGFQVSCELPPEKPAGEIRSVLFISSDDHAAYAMGSYGNPIIRTPNLDRLAAEGIRFARAYANSPICTPSRQSLLTGRYPHASGVSLLETPLSQDQVTIAEHLKNYGFATGAVGKMHFNSDLKHGFDDRIDSRDHHQYMKEHPPRRPPEGTRVKPVWRPFQDPARIWLNADMLPGTGFGAARDPDLRGLYDEDSLGTYFVRRAVDFLRENRGNRFCLWLSFYEPHSPFNFPIEFAGKYRSSDMPLPEVSPEDDRWVPAIFRSLSDEQKRGIVASYYSSVEYMDKNVGLALAALRELGLDRTTLVVYVGDHGYQLGHHGRFEKHTMWEESVRVPLLIRDPRQPHRTIRALVEMLDLVPTILEVLEVPPMPTAQGRSLVPLMRGETEHHRDFVFSEYYEDNKAMVRTRQWKYVFTSGKHDLAIGYATGLGPSGRHHRLYDRRDDPQEFKNLAQDPKHEPVVKDLQAKMLGVFLATDARAPNLPEGLSREEKLEWFLEPPEPPK